LFCHGKQDIKRLAFDIITMELAHSIEIRVFCNQEESETDVVGGLRWLVSINLEEANVAIRKQSALGFNERRISIFEVTLEKKKHVKEALSSILQRLPDKQMERVKKQLDSRIDEHASFFLRFDKETLLKHKELLVTDSGNCYHVKIKIAAFPSTKEKAKAIMTELLSKLTSCEK
jgi:RNA binding exosome subunit